jgi:hypothetical protein
MLGIHSRRGTISEHRDGEHRDKKLNDGLHRNTS